MYTNLEQMLEPSPGILLIAEPFLKDPNFMRTVVLLCDHQEEGSFGFVLNKDIRHTIDEIIPELEGIKIPVFFGGPVQPYIGLGAGGNFVSYNQYLGEFASGKSGIYFAASPEAGIMVPFSRHGASAFTAGARYNFMPYKNGDAKDLNNWGVYAGIKFPLK